MKKPIIAILIAFLVSVCSFEVQAADQPSTSSVKSETSVKATKWQKPPRHLRKKLRYRRVHSAPLDGGLLALLGAAGIAWYVTRKKKTV